jgi:uncharacterized iron-regulated membrane protein
MPIDCECSASQKHLEDHAPVLNPALIARSLHKWLGLIVGLQILIWLASGLYMVVVDIDFIHGDSLVKNMQEPVVVPDTPAVSFADLRTNYQGLTQIALRPVMGKTYYTVTTADERYLLDPESGEVISPLDEQTAREIARYHFAGDAAVINATLITSNPPMEIQTRGLPLWRIDFDDRFNTSFYIDPFDGALVTRRHQYWRIFDFMWMLHIMDYEDRSDAHNLLLITAQSTGLAFAISGLWLLFYSFSGRRKKNRKATS